MTDAEFLDEIERIETAQCKRDGRIMFGAYPLSRTERDRLVALARGEIRDELRAHNIELQAKADQMYADLNAISARVPEHPGTIRERTINELDQLRAALEVAQADSELLGKVEKLLRADMLTYTCEVFVDVFGARVCIRYDRGTKAVTGPTLADALRALVGETT